MRRFLTSIAVLALSATGFAAETVIEVQLAEPEEAEAALAPSIHGTLVTEFFKRNKYWTPRISPNGQLVAVLETIDDVREIVLLDFANGRKLKLLEEKLRTLEIRSLYWVDDEHIAFTYDSYGQQRMGLISLVFVDGIATDLTVKVLGNDWYMLDPLPTVPKRAVVVVVRSGKPHIFRIDTDNPKESVTRLINSRFQNMIHKSTGWMTDVNGRVRAVTEYDHDKLTKIIWYRTDDSNKWREIWKGDPATIFVPLLAHPDNRSITVITNENTEHAILTTYNRVSGDYGETLFSVAGADVESAEVNPAKTRVVSVFTIRNGISEQHFLQDPTVAFPKLLDTQAYGSAPYVIDLSYDERHAIVRTSTNDDPGEFFLFDTDKNLSYRIGHLRPWLSKFRLGKTRTIITVAQDGLEIESYLTIPDPVYERPPLIVMPHGGPISVRDTRDFDSTVQLFATLGYAVLQTNYRGSGGFGKTFESKGERQWGRQIEDDIEASLETVFDLDIVDSNKVCIYGASYGGYSALISAVRSPHLYSCAGSFAGVTDMSLLFHEFGVNHSNIIREAVERIVGDPGEDMDSLIEFSPVFNAERISMPVLLAHGDQDETVDIEHFDRMKMMLEYYEKNARFLVLKGEGHGTRYLNSDIRLFTALDDLFRSAMGLPAPDKEKMLAPGAVWPEAEQDVTDQ